VCRRGYTSGAGDKYPTACRVSPPTEPVTRLLSRGNAASVSLAGAIAASIADLSSRSHALVRRRPPQTQLSPTDDGHSCCWLPRQRDDWLFAEVSQTPTEFSGFSMPFRYSSEPRNQPKRRYDTIRDAVLTCARKPT